MGGISFLIAVLMVCSQLVDAAYKINVAKRRHGPRITARNPGVVNVTARYDTAYALGGSYFANITIGNPPQRLEVVLDTGSSDLVIVTPDMCNDRDSDLACVGGQFDPSLSHSYSIKVPNAMNISYGDGTGATGDYSTDDVSFGGATLRNGDMSVGTKGGITTSIMGIGPDSDISTFPAVQAQTTLDALIANNLTDSKLFSVWFDDDAATGSVLFGGIDETKFDTKTGLVTLDMISDPENPEVPFSSYVVAVTGISTSIAGQVLTYSLPSQKPSSRSPADTYLPMVMDTGSAAIIVPNDIFNEINYHIGADPDLPIPGGPGFLCSQAQNKTIQESTLSWTLGDPKNGSASITYSTSFADLVVPVSHPLTRKPYSMPNPNGEGQVDLCTFGLEAIGPEGGDAIIGAQGIKQMYIVYDQDHKQLSFGKPIFNVTGTSADVPVPANSTIPQINRNVTSTPSVSVPRFTPPPRPTPAPLVQPGNPSGAPGGQNGKMLALVAGVFATFVCTFAFGP